jgi:hypothetical protein
MNQRGSQKVYNDINQASSLGDNEQTGMTSSNGPGDPSAGQHLVSQPTPFENRISQVDRIDNDMPAIVDYNRTKHHFNVS